MKMKKGNSPDLVELSDEALDNVIGGIDTSAQFGNGQDTLSESLTKLTSVSKIA
ncbi:MAG: hypothetical protein MJ173_08405 [Clostridia bacterium]|nr:hypothetical protein [Clostridia bacterium]